MAPRVRGGGGAGDEPGPAQIVLRRATDPESGRKERGVTEIRGAAAAERIKQDVFRLDELRRAKKG
jgi:hypothetical protein